MIYRIVADLYVAWAFI